MALPERCQRANPIHFVIKPGHEIEAIERVIAENGGYGVVEALETLRKMRAACMADPACPPDVLRAST